MYEASRASATRNGLRAATVANTIYLFVGAETEILKYEATTSSWVYNARMTAKEGSKLEVSTVNCSVIQHYLTNTTGAPTTIRPTSKGLSPSLHLNLLLYEILINIFVIFVLNVVQLRKPLLLKFHVQTLSTETKHLQN